MYPGYCDNGSCGAIVSLGARRGRVQTYREAVADTQNLEVNRYTLDGAGCNRSVLLQEIAAQVVNVPSLRCHVSYDSYAANVGP